MTLNINKHRSFFFITILFLTGILILVLISTFYQRNVIFWDCAGAGVGENVSSDYYSNIPFIRYFIEPIAGISFLLNVDYRWLFGFALFFIIARIIYLGFQKKYGHYSEKKVLLNYIFYDFYKFSFIVLFVNGAIFTLIIGIGFLLYGYFFIFFYFMTILNIGMRICFILILIKFVSILIKLKKPSYKFNYSKTIGKNNSSNERVPSKKTDLMKKESVYLFGTLLLLLGANFLLVTIRFPTHEIDANLEDDEFLFDFHVHTSMSDGSLTPEERVMWYIQHGIGAQLLLTIIIKEVLLLLRNL